MSLANTLHIINVSLVYAEKQQQWFKEVTVPRGTTAGELIEQTQILAQVPGLTPQSLGELVLGVYAEKVSLDYMLEEGDRLEIYRPLTADPKEVRRQLALLGKTMGKNINK